MEWISEKINSAPSYKRLLVVVQFVDPIDVVHEGYSVKEELLTDPFIVIARKFNGYWNCGGQVTHWMPLPQSPTIFPEQAN